VPIVNCPLPNWSVKLAGATTAFGHFTL
jgi:hypothetical protein